jgi:hypothetical protein
MVDDPATPPDDGTPATPADTVARPEQPPMDDQADAATPEEVEDEAAKLGDFA